MATRLIQLIKQRTAENPAHRSTLATTVPKSKEDAAEATNDETESSSADEYPHGARLTAIVVSLLLSMFLVALDNVGYNHRDRTTS